MTFDSNAFADRLRRSLAGEPIDTTTNSPTPSPAPPRLEVTLQTGPIAVDVKTAPTHAWVLTPTRNAEGLIVSIDLRPSERIYL